MVPAQKTEPLRTKSHLRLRIEQIRDFLVRPANEPDLAQPQLVEVKAGDAKALDEFAGLGSLHRDELDEEIGDAPYERDVLR